MIVNAAVRCLDVITPGLNLPHSLPPNMAAKYRVGQEIAQACLDLGYKGEIGYQTFLYSGETEIRRILMFLVERLPKEETAFLREPTSSELFLSRIKCKTREQLTKPWLPYEVCPERKFSPFEACTESFHSPDEGWFLSTCFRVLSR